MKRALVVITRLAYGVAAVCILTLGTTQLVAAEAMPCNGPEQIGTCPGDYTAETCDYDCREVYNWEFGECWGGCCTCAT